MEGIILPLNYLRIYAIIILSLWRNLIITLFDKENLRLRRGWQKDAISRRKGVSPVKYYN